MSSGGGSAGTVEFPAHVEDIHKEMFGYSGAAKDITTDMSDVLNTALGTGGNPYENATVYNPYPELRSTRNRFDNYADQVEALDEQEDYTALLAKAVEEVDADGVLNSVDIDTIVSSAVTDSGTELTAAINAAVDAINDDVIQGVINTHAERAEYQRTRSLRRFNATMADVNAVQSSAFILGQAMIEAEHLREVQQMDADLTQQTYAASLDAHITLYREQLRAELQASIQEKMTRDKLMAASMQTMVNMLQGRVSMQQAAAQLRAEIDRIAIVAQREYEASETDLNVGFATWDLEVWQYGANLLSSPNGSASMIPKGKSQAQTALGGALKGAAIGGASGGPAAPLTALAGAVAGGIGGLIAGNQ